MKKDYACAPSSRELNAIEPNMHFSTGMRRSIFCPCPGGDSPSAKRMFDSLIVGCIPVILSKDFVWPFTNEFDPTLALDPSEFSIRLQATDYDTELLDSTTCQPLDPARPGLQAYLDAIPPATIAKLQSAAQHAGELYSWYAHTPDVPTNPLRDGYLPDGGTAHFVVAALAERARGNRWPSCEAELERVRPLQRKDPMKFEC